MRKLNLMPTVVLSSICIIVALLLSVVNGFTTAIIEGNSSNKTNEALAEVLPGATDFTKLDINNYDFYSEVIEAYEADNGGCVFKMSVVGYKAGLVILCGVDADGNIAGSKYLESQETNGAEDKLNGFYDGKNAKDLKAEIIAGSTKTSKAYFKAVEVALDSFSVVKEG